MPQFVRGNTVKILQVVYRYRTPDEQVSHITKMENDGYKWSGANSGNMNGWFYVDVLFEKREGEVGDILS